MLLTDGGADLRVVKADGACAMQASVTV